MRHALCFIVSCCFLPQGQAETGLKGSVESQQRQNMVAYIDNLPRIKNGEDLMLLIEDGTLVPLRETVGLVIDKRLKPEFRFVMPWTRDFLEDLGSRFYEKFRIKLQINSAVRTIAYQKELQKTNKNAAPAEGDRQSSHVTGATVDISKLTLSKEHIEWLQEEFLAFEKNGHGEATEEMHQAVFHVMVFRSVVVGTRIFSSNPLE